MVDHSSLGRAGQLSIFCLLLLISCAVPLSPRPMSSPTLPPPSELEGSDWVLVSIDGVSPIAGTEPTLIFENRKIGGYSGCTWYGSQTYGAANGALTFDVMAITAMLCADPAVMAQEKSYHNYLRSGARYRVGGDTLEIGPGGKPAALAYRRRLRLAMDPHDLIGSRWLLESYDGRLPPDGTIVTAAFVAGRVSGYDGCRHYEATYEAEGDNIRLTMMSQEMDYDCAKPREQPSGQPGFDTGLTNVRHYRLSGDMLELYSDGGHVARYRVLAEGNEPTLRTTTWVLQYFSELDKAWVPIPQTELTLAFKEDLISRQGEVSGSGGCNRYTASYVFQASYLVFRPPIATELFCVEPAGIMEQEKHFFSLLRDAAIYSIGGSEFRLEARDGRALVFKSKGE